MRTHPDRYEKPSRHLWDDSSSRRTCDRPLDNLYFINQRTRCIQRETTKRWNSCKHSSFASSRVTAIFLCDIFLLFLFYHPTLEIFKFPLKVVYSIQEISVFGVHRMSFVRVLVWRDVLVLSLIINHIRKGNIYYKTRITIRRFVIKIRKLPYRSTRIIRIVVTIFLYEFKLETIILTWKLL